MKSKLISLVSNDYWGLYKFRYDIIHMLIRQGYKIILIAKKDEYHKKFNNKNILKHFIKLEHRSVNIFTEIRTMIDLYKIYKKSNKFRRMSFKSFRETCRINLDLNILILSIARVKISGRAGTLSADRMLRDRVVTAGGRGPLPHPSPWPGARSFADPGRPQCRLLFQPQPVHPWSPGRGRWAMARVAGAHILLVPPPPRLR